MRGRREALIRLTDAFRLIGAVLDSAPQGFSVWDRTTSG